MSISRKKVGNSSIWSVEPNRYWIMIALAIAAGAIGYSGHDGWGWCLLLIFILV